MEHKMLIKFITLFALFISAVFAQEEEQRKYVFTTPSTNTITIINGGGQLDGLTIKKHSDFEYFDLYLDTENLALIKNKLSLRIRKRDYGNGEIAYGIQLKSEMLKAGDIRMEIDENELDYMTIYFNGKKIPLNKTLETIYQRFNQIISGTEKVDLTQDAVLKEQIGVLNHWISFKVNAAIAPFQKLRNLKIDRAELATLRPLLLGKSIRARSHVFIDRESTTPDLINFKASQMEASSIPAMLQSNRYVWLMESSFDRAIFFGLEKSGFHIINEYEVENKYRPLLQGREMLDRFEQQVVRQLDGDINLESKYLQSMKEIYQLGDTRE
jgi:hypothetical protein